MIATPILAAAIVLASTSAAAVQVDPLTVKVDDTAVQRFAKLWRATNGRPTAAQLQAQYLDNGGRAIEVFTPNRIGDAKRLAAKIAENPGVYRDAVERCLPWVAATNAQLRATYLGLKGLLPDRELPQIALVLGANNSGGTAAPGIQVVGLEVICRLSATEAAFEEKMRQFFAHETVHTFQSANSETNAADPLLAAALGEGVPDYVTALVTARVPDPERDSWARNREKWLWEQFQTDAAIVRAGAKAKGDARDKADAAFRRWFANAGDPPPGWPDEMGYWVGMRIAEAYVASSSDPHAAIAELIAASDPAAILTKSGSGIRFPQ